MFIMEKCPENAICENAIIGSAVLAFYVNIILGVWGQLDVPSNRQSHNKCFLLTGSEHVSVY